MSAHSAVKAYRSELPRPIPKRIARLHVDDRGYPVPWFVAWQDEDFNVTKRGVGTPDFRIIHPGVIKRAIQEDRCWICGGRITGVKSFLIGPMCAVNRNNAEPPSHYECADWAARACPFLVRPHARRNEKTKNPDAVEPAGVMVRRNPGCCAVWNVKAYTLHRDPSGGVLFRLPNPTSVTWWREGRLATRAEVEYSIETGLPLLREYCHGPEDLAALDAEVRAIERYLPKV